MAWLGPVFSVCLLLGVAALSAAAGGFVVARKATSRSRVVFGLGLVCGFAAGAIAGRRGRVGAGAWVRRGALYALKSRSR